MASTKKWLAKWLPSKQSSITDEDMALTETLIGNADDSWIQLSSPPPLIDSRGPLRQLKDLQILSSHASRLNGNFIPT